MGNVAGQPIEYFSALPHRLTIWVSAAKAAGSETLLDSPSEGSTEGFWPGSVREFIVRPSSSTTAELHRGSPETAAMESNLEVDVGLWTSASGRG